MDFSLSSPWIKCTCQIWSRALMQALPLQRYLLEELVGFHDVPYWLQLCLMFSSSSADPHFLTSAASWAGGYHPKNRCGGNWIATCCIATVSTEWLWKCGYFSVSCGFTWETIAVVFGALLYWHFSTFPKMESGRETEAAESSQKGGWVKNTCTYQAP